MPKSLWWSIAPKPHVVKVACPYQRSNCVCSSSCIRPSEPREILKVAQAAAVTTRSQVQCTTECKARAHPGTWTIGKTSRPRPGPVRPSSVPTGGKYALAKFVPSPSQWPPCCRLAPDGAYEQG